MGRSAKYDKREACRGCGKRKVMKMLASKRTESLFLLLLAPSVPVLAQNCGFYPGGYGPTIQNGALDGTTCETKHMIMFQYSNLGDWACSYGHGIENNLSDYPTQCGYCDVPARYRPLHPLSGWFHST
jgi:hypothetical protein